MEDLKKENCALVTAWLMQIKERLLDDRCKLSDVLLFTLRTGRIHFAETRLSVLSRELLGYNEEETALARELFDEGSKNATATAQALWRYGAPVHRMMSGFSVPLLANITRLNNSERPLVKKYTRFVGHGIISLEQLLEAALSENSPYVVTDFDEDENCLLVSKASDLSVLLDEGRHYAANFIDGMIADLKKEDISRRVA